MEALAVTQTDRIRFTALTSAMLRSGGSSAASAIFSAISSKIVAGVAGPAGIGLLATLQQARQTALVAASVNGQTALIQGASARTDAAQGQYIRTVLLIMGLATAATAASLLAAPQLWTALLGLGPERAYLIRLLSIPLMVSVVLVGLLGLLNANGEIGRVALVQIVAPLTMATFAYPAALAARGGREAVLILLMTVATILPVIVAAVALWPHRGQLFDALAARPWWDILAARGFFSIAATMFVTGLLGSGALLAVRHRILTEAGLAATGHFDAAWSISMNQVTLVLSSMQTFFLPALARSVNARERSAHVGHGLIVAAAVVAPTAVLIALLKPQIISTLYSNEFQITAQYLRWTLLGDYLKVASWILSVPLLAAADMRGFLFADVAAYSTFITSSAVLSRWLPVAEAAACGFLLMYAVHLIVCGVLASSRHGIRISLSTGLTWLTGLAGLAAVSAFTWEVQ